MEPDPDEVALRAMRAVAPDHCGDLRWWVNDGGVLEMLVEYRSQFAPAIEGYGPGCDLVAVGAGNIDLLEAAYASSATIEGPDDAHLTLNLASMLFVGWATESRPVESWLDGRDPRWRRLLASVPPVPASAIPAPPTDHDELALRVLRAAPNLGWGPDLGWWAEDDGLRVAVPCTDAFVPADGPRGHRHDEQLVTAAEVELYESTWHQCREAFGNDARRTAEDLFVARVRGTRPREGYSAWSWWSAYERALFDDLGQSEYGRRSDP